MHDAHLILPPSPVQIHVNPNYVAFKIGRRRTYESPTASVMRWASKSVPGEFVDESRHVLVNRKLIMIVTVSEDDLWVLRCITNKQKM